MAGPLAGIRIVEMAGIGPGPFAAMMLADHGAEVIRVERPGAPYEPSDPLLRSRTSVTLDLKDGGDIKRLRALCREADGLIEGYRPGVMERLGIGPKVLLADNPRLVYGRMTGWGQEGPRAKLAGHDIDYIAISGVLGMTGRQGERPLPPLNIAGDFGGGGMMLAFGMVSALFATRCGVAGQVVDCAMTDGSALLSAMMWGFRAAGSWKEACGTNLLDTGAPYYEVYETADRQFVAIGAIEPHFYAALRSRMGVEDEVCLDEQGDRDLWPDQKARFAALFRQRTRAEWSVLLDESDACFAPVLSMSEALVDPHNVARRTFISLDGVEQPAPAPRYSVTECDQPRPPRRPGEDGVRILGGLESKC